MAVGSLYNYYRAQNARLRAYNKQVLDSYDSQVAGLGSALFGTLQNAGATSVSNGWKIAAKRIAADQQKKIDAALKDLQGTQALINAPTTSSSSSSVSVSSSASSTATSATSASSSTTATSSVTTVTPATSTDTSSTTSDATTAASTTTSSAPGSSVNIVA